MFIWRGPYILRAWHRLPWRWLNHECREKILKKKWYAAGANQAMISTGNLKSGLNLKLLSCLWPAFQAFSTAMFDFKKRSRNSYLYSPPFSAVMKLIWWRPQQYDHKQAAFTHSKNSSAWQYILIGHFRVPQMKPHLRPNEAKCKTFFMKMSFICIEVIFILKASH